ncbi:MAG: hypothetical protein P1V97_15715, partial [Planctomycetota bacterium]|nr:hypothetical protein [Planctomycetota bacterium]
KEIGILEKELAEFRASDTQNLTKQIGEHFVKRWNSVIQEVVQMIRKGQKEQSYNLYQKLRVNAPNKQVYYLFLMGRKRQLKALGQQQAATAFKNLVNQVEQNLKKQQGGSGN